MLLDVVATWSWRSLVTPGYLTFAPAGVRIQYHLYITISCILSNTAILFATLSSLSFP
jgi:hypothetical protein